MINKKNIQKLFFLSAIIILMGSGLKPITTTKLVHIIILQYLPIIVTIEGATGVLLITKILRQKIGVWTILGVVTAANIFSSIYVILAIDVLPSFHIWLWVHFVISALLEALIIYVLLKNKLEHPIQDSLIISTVINGAALLVFFILEGILAILNVL